MVYLIFIIKFVDMMYIRDSAFVTYRIRLTKALYRFVNMIGESSWD